MKHRYVRKNANYFYIWKKYFCISSAGVKSFIYIDTPNISIYMTFILKIKIKKHNPKNYIWSYMTKKMISMFLLSIFHMLQYVSSAYDAFVCKKWLVFTAIMLFIETRRLQIKRWLRDIEILKNINKNKIK